MADVMAHFLRGHAAGQAEQEHAQQLEENRIRTMVLKHQLSSIKLEDALRANKLRRDYADLQLGQDQPSSAADTSGAAGGAPDAAGGARGTAPSQQATEPGGPSTSFGPFATGYRLPANISGPGPAPPASLADVVTNMVGSRLAQSGGGSAQSAPGAQSPMSSPSGPSPMTAAGRHVVASDPSSGLPPLNLHNDEPVPAGYQEAGASGPGVASGTQNFGTQNHPAMKGSGHVWLQPISIPELGIDIPGQWFSAKAAREEESRRAIALKRAEQPLHNVGPEETALQTNIDTGRPEPVYTNPNKKNKPLNEQYLDAQRRGDTAEANRILGAINSTRSRSEFGEFQALYAEGLGAQSFADLTPAQKAGAIPAYTKARQDPEVQKQLAAGRDLNDTFKRFMMARDRDTDADRESQREFKQQHSLYLDEVTQATRQHTAQMKTWAAEQAYVIDGVNTYTNKPAMAMPEYAPPTFEEWQAQRGTAKPPKDTGVADPRDVALPASGKKASATPAAGSKQVTLAELQKIAARRGTTVDAERARVRSRRGMPSFVEAALEMCITEVADRALKRGGCRG